VGNLSLFCLAQENIVENLTALEVFALIEENTDNPDFVIVDVRTPEEFKSGYLGGAVNVDVNSETFKEDIAKLDKSKNYLVYCRSGGRSSRAVSIMQELGFTNIYHMSKGITEWIAEGLPVEKNGNSR
jgi:rhodanese-related sulfurtransferase